MTVAVAHEAELRGTDLAVLHVVDSIEPELLVIGARRRSPVGKAPTGSVTQTVILQAAVPVLVVKAA